MILGLVLAFLIGLGTDLGLGTLYNYVKRKNLLKQWVPTPINQSKLCEKMHLWITTSVLTQEGQKETKMCKICGFLPETNTMAPPEAIDRMEEFARLRKIEDKLYEEFYTKEMMSINEFLKQEYSKGSKTFTPEMLVTIHEKGATFEDRYHQYKLSKKDDIIKEMQRDYN